MFGLGKPTVVTDEGRVEEVLARGVAEVIDRDELTKEMCSGRRLRIKLGIDPTSPHLHLGRSVPLLKLRDFQELGHQAVLIVGNATGIVGDTSDKESERPMLTERQVEENARTYFKQAGLLLDMSLVEKRYNAHWLNALGYAEIGEHANQFSVADFIARDNIKRRLTGGKRVSLREILYPLMQGYDSVAVRADVEVGGVDQRFNLLAGRTLQNHFDQKPQHVVMTEFPIEGLDGRKMSSSWGNTVNLDDRPGDMYGKIMSVRDDLVGRYFTLLTRVPLDEIERLKREHPRDAKMVLAREIVTLYHGEKLAKEAEEEFVATFQKGDMPMDIKGVRVARGTPLAEALLRAGTVSSKSEFRRLIEEGGVRWHETGKRVVDSEVRVEPGVLKVGKRRFIKIEVTS